MAVGVKLLHIVSDNYHIKVVHRFVLSPFFKNVAATKVYRFLVVLFVLGLTTVAWTVC